MATEDPTNSRPESFVKPGDAAPGAPNGQQRQGDEILLADERRFRAFTAASGGIFYQMNADWSAMQPLDGRGLVASNDAPMRDWLQKNIPESEHAAIRERIARCIGQKTVFELEHRVYRPDRSIGWTSSRAVPVLDDAGQIVEWIGSATDITDRKSAEDRLRRSHDTFYHLIQNNPFGIYVVDSDFRLRQVSLGAQNVFAHVPRPLLGRDFGEVLRSIWAEPFASEAVGRFRQTLETGEPYVAEKTVEQRQDIKRVEAYDWRIERVILPDGRFGVVCYFYDLSERQQWEAALAASEARLHLTANAIPALIAYVDADCRYQFVNAAYQEWFGVDPERVIGRAVREIVGDAVYAERRRQIEQALSGEKVRFEHAMPHTRLGHRETETSYVPDVADDGSVRGFVVLVYDITERAETQQKREQLLASEQAARAEAERAGRRKDEFLATLSHELRTPLNAILGWSQVLRADKSLPADSAEGLAVIERNARSQAQIIEDLLDMSRIISGKLRLDVQRLELGPIVEAAVETVRPAAEARGVRLQVVIDPKAGPVSGDAGRLQQVLWNLLSNAIKFTPRAGRVQVRLERVSSHIEMSVSDTGQGIRPEFLPYVFDRFRQADASSTRAHGGLGIGLALVKQLVELHGGSVSAKSSGEGSGSTFVVTLPLMVLYSPPAAGPDRRTSPAPVIAAGLAPPIGPTIKGVRVLVVDDEPDARGLVKRLLEDCQANVVAVGSAAEAVESLTAGEQFDVIVSDIGLPGEDGHALIRRVRNLPHTQGGGTPAIALTAYARSEDRMRSVLAGFQMHVPKPFEPAELIAMVASLARRA